MNLSRLPDYLDRMLSYRTVGAKDFQSRTGLSSEFINYEYILTVEERDRETDREEEFKS